MPFSPDAVANYLIGISKRKGVPITPMKLQKLMFFAHGWHLALEKDGSPLVSEDVQAWEYGPVFPSTYHEFKDFGGRAISRPALQNRYDDSGGLQMFFPSLDEESREPGMDAAFAKAVLERIWDVYSPFPAAALSDKTHEKGSPWWTVREKAKKELKGHIPRGLNIPNPMIREWFKTQFQKPAG